MENFNSILVIGICIISILSGIIVYFVTKREFEKLEIETMIKAVDLEIKNLEKEKKDRF